MKKFNVLILFILLSNCEKKEFLNNFKYDEFGYSERQFVLQNNIKEILYHDIHFDLNENPTWEKTMQKKVFDKKGNLIYSVWPEYLKRKYENAEIPKSSSFSTIWNHALNLGETNIQTGKIDTIFFKYDESNNLILRKDNFSTTKYKYDIFGNEVERFFIPRLGETVVNYTSYNYLDDAGKINFVKDSMPNSSVHKQQLLKEIQRMNTKKIYYKYDDLGRIVFDRKGYRTYDEQGRVVEVKDGQIFYKMIAEYDKKGNISSKTFINIHNSSITENDKTVNFKKIDTTSIEHYLYNDMELPIQVKTVDKNGKMISLSKIDYTFFN